MSAGYSRKTFNLLFYERNNLNLSGSIAMALVVLVIPASSASYVDHNADDLILAGKIDLIILEEPVYYTECPGNSALLKEGYMISIDSTYYRTVTPGSHESIANFSLFKDGELVKRSEIMDGDTFYYNKTIDGKEYTIIEFKVIGIYHVDGGCTGTAVMIRPFFQYTDGNRTGKKDIPIGTAGIPPSEEWNRTIMEPGTGSFSSAQQTSDGGYIFAGENLLFKTGGRKQWSRRFLDSRISSVRQTWDGSYVFAGSRYTSSGSAMDAWLAMADQDGNEKWSRTFMGGEWGMTNSVSSFMQTGDGGYILAGSSEFSDNSQSSGWLIKVDANGRQQWNRTFFSAGAKGGKNGIASVSQTEDQGYILAGTTFLHKENEPFPQADAWLIKTDSMGNEQWNRTFGGMGDDRASSVLQIRDNGYIIAGYTQSSSPGYRVQMVSNDSMHILRLAEYYDVWLIRTDAEGKEEWNRSFGGLGDDRVAAVLQTGDGGYVLAGRTWSFGTDFDGWIIRTDAKGNVRWDRTFGGVDFDEISSVQQTADGGYFIAGKKNWRNAWLIKLRPEQNASAKTPVTSPTGTLASNPTQALTAVPIGTNTTIPPEKAAGFELVLSITIILALHIAGGKRR